MTDKIPIVFRDPAGEAHVIGEAEVETNEDGDVVYKGHLHGKSEGGSLFADSIKTSIGFSSGDVSIPQRPEPVDVTELRRSPKFVSSEEIERLMSEWS